jgi:hypothetical protein
VFGTSARNSRTLWPLLLGLDHVLLGCGDDAHEFLDFGLRNVEFLERRLADLSNHVQDHRFARSDAMAMIAGEDGGWWVLPSIRAGAWRTVNE